MNQIENSTVEKAYLNHLGNVIGIQDSFNSVLLCLLKFAKSDTGDGLTLYVNKSLKNDIAACCNVSLSRINQAITVFTKCGYMKRVSTGKYLFNPDFFGYDEWDNISNITAEYNYRDNKIKVEIV